MYTSFYHLRENPFRITTDPKFLWMGDTHNEALASLKYAVLQNIGFLLLTGEVGTGKTTLINALINTLNSHVLIGGVVDPCFESLDFFRHVAKSFNIKEKIVENRRRNRRVEFRRIP